MALAFDSSSSVYQGSTVTSQNLPHTCSGPNRILVASTRTYDGDGVSGVTYNGIAMSQVGSDQILGSDYVKAWILVAPATGSNNITATISPARRIEIYGISFTGALQTGQPDANNSATGTSTSATGAVTTIADNCWVVANTESNGATGTPASSTNCTVVQAITDRGGVGYGGPKTPAGSFTQAISWSVPGGWGFIQVSIAPAPNLQNVKTIDGLAKADVKMINGTNIGDIKSINGLE